MASLPSPGREASFRGVSAMRTPPGLLPHEGRIEEGETMPSPSLTRPAVRLLAAVLLALAAGGPAPQAEVEAPPPWPILLEGIALLDGAPADGVLTAHIADWSSRPVPVADGRFGRPLGLIIGPPTAGYVGQSVTFRLTGPDGAVHESTFTFPFPVLPEPTRNAAQLEFHAPQPPVPLAAVLLVLAAVALLVAVGALVLRRRRPRRRPS